MQPVAVPWGVGALGPVYMLTAEQVFDKPVTIDVPDEGEESDGVCAGVGMQITFQELVYKVRNKQNNKENITILHGLSGFFNPSQMTAVMGPRYAAALHSAEWHTAMQQAMPLCSRHCMS